MLAAFVLASLVAPRARAQNESSYDPPLKRLDTAGEKALESIQVPDGFVARRIAAEPMLANPVAFAIDSHGRYFVAETFRLKKGVFDNRDHMDWLDRDLAAETVEDRLAMYREYFGEQVVNWEVDHERIRLLEDRDGDGNIDHSTVFADGFSNLADGVAAGIMVRDGDVYFTCIPHLWKLRDDDRDGRADTRQSLSEGYGIHVSLMGHDLHGLTLGLDGRVYFSIGDRGFRVLTDEGRLLYLQNEGAVFRCEPDGTALELFATGLRNPQELAFDAYGNLFTGENNGDAGDKARWMYLMPGADIGWRIGFQWLPDRGPWKAERMWELPHPGQPAFVYPPLAHIGSGPSGLAYYPGTGLPARYDDCFFLCDFRGQPKGSGIFALRNEPRGAGFALAYEERFIDNILPTDCAFGVDGGLTLSDWVMGWDQTMRGRLYTVRAPLGKRGEELVHEVAELLRADFSLFEVERLTELLGHRDQRIRLNAQLALVERATASDAGALKALTSTAAKDLDRQLARVHAIQGLAIVHRRSTEQPRNNILGTLLEDSDAEIRAQACIAAGESAAHSSGLVPSILSVAKQDRNARVRAQAAIALGKIAAANAGANAERRIRDALVTVLETNNFEDPFLRHAAIYGLELVGASGPDGLAAVLEAVRNANANVRLACAVTLRRLRRPEIALLLNDREHLVVIEAARAIYDEPIPDAMADLGRLLDQPFDPDALDTVLTRRRAMNARYHVGRQQDADAIARAAARVDLPEAIRIEALSILAEWEVAARQDRIVGDWRKLPTEHRRAPHARQALRRIATELLARETPGPVRSATASAIGTLKLTDPTTSRALRAIVTTESDTDEVRSACFNALAVIDEGAAVALARTLEKTDKQLRQSVLTVLARREPSAALAQLKPLLESKKAADRRSAFDVLGGVDLPEAHSLLAKQVRAFAETRLRPSDTANFPGAAALELVRAAETNTSPETQEALQDWLLGQAPEKMVLEPFAVCLEGGDASRGFRLFHYEPATSCRRCHQVGPYGGEAGPKLDGIGSQRSREELLESLIMPQARIAEGFQQVVLGLRDGGTVIGTLKSENDEHVVVVLESGHTRQVEKAEITSRSESGSAMPAIAAGLPKEDVRDLIEYLASLKDPEVEKKRKEAATEKAKAEASTTASGHGDV